MKNKVLCGILVVCTVFLAMCMAELGYVGYLMLLDRVQLFTVVPENCWYAWFFLGVSFGVLLQFCINMIFSKKVSDGDDHS